MTLRTDYLGLTLENPLVVSAGPLTRSLDHIRAAEDAGVGAIVMHSLFEEDVRESEDKAELETFLAHLEAAKKAVDTPIIGSLNGVSNSGWVDFAAYLERAGADALELNTYQVCADHRVTGAEVDESVVAIARGVRDRVTVPFAVKLSPFHSSLANLASQLAKAGTDGLVLFNRFYQPDIDLDQLTASPQIQLSSSTEMRLPLRWIALLYDRFPIDLALSTGVHGYEDVLKGILAGANVTMITSELLQNGWLRIEEILEELRRWLAKSDYEALTQIQGLLSQKRAPNPAALERANYRQSLTGYEPDEVL